MFKVDADRQLVYLKGSIPGKPGSVVYVRDAIKRAVKNEELINYPTFIATQGQQLARLMTM